VRQQLTNRCAGVGTGRRVLAHLVVERQPSIRRAAQGQRSDKGLGCAVELKRRVRPRLDVLFDVLLAERRLPDDIGRTDNRGRQARNASLNAQRVEILGKSGLHEVVGVHEHHS